MSDFDKTWRQNVQAETPKKFLQRESHRSNSALVGIVFVAERDGAIFPDLHPDKGTPVDAACVTDDVIYPHIVGGDAIVPQTGWINPTDEPNA